jgi:hypothetical protein
MSFFNFMKDLGVGWFEEAEQKTGSAVLRPARFRGLARKLF